MNTVTIGVESVDSVKARLKEAVRGKPQGAFITFASVDLMWETLNQRRWAIVRAMTGAGPMSIREVARRVDRDVKAVHGDVHILLTGGVLTKTQGGQIEFPYDAVHVDFLLEPEHA